MRRIGVAIVISLCTCSAWAERPLQQVLFDFEGGLEGWTVNVWGGGGTVTLSAAGEPKFGSGALHSDVAAVERGGNTISPWLPMEAEWREHDWGVISLWFRGDGTPTRAVLHVETGEGEEVAQGYSYNLPMDNTEWRRISAPVRSFWNREGVPMDTRRILRVYIGHSGDHQWEADQIALEAPQRPVPLTKPGGDELDVAAELLQFGDGRYGLRFDPSPLMPGPASAEASFALPGVSETATERFAGVVAEGEALLIAPAAAESGEAALTLTVARGQDAASATWSFDAVANRPLPEPTRLSLLPAPKECTLGEGAFQFGEQLKFRGTGPITGDILRLAARMLYPYANSIDADMIPWEPGQPIRLEFGAGQSLSGEDASRLEELPTGGYVLYADSQGASVHARDKEGLRNGALTLIQAAESHYALTGERAIPSMHVVDWPSLAIRAVSLSLPNARWGHPNDPPADPQMFIEFLRRTMLQTKMNMAVITIHQAMLYDTHPEVSGPAAWSKDEVKRVFDTLRSWGVEPVPLMNSLGHMNWLCIPHEELAEDGDVHQICTSHPDSERIVKELYQEIIDLVEPTYFHVGLDETRWNTESLPAEQRCPRCAGVSKQDVFADWVSVLHEFLDAQGIQMMMWGDMILPGHNGGPPYNLAETVDRLPKEVLITNWSTRMMPHSHQWLLDRGFAGIIKSNSRGATLAEQPLLLGNMFGCWYKVPWLVEGTSENLEGNAYGSFLEAAEYSWNHWTDMFDIMPPLTGEFFAERPLVQWRVGAQPVDGGEITPIALPAATAIEGLPAGPVSFARLRFEVAGGVMPEVGAEVTVPVQRQAEALYFLHGAQLADRAAMVEALKAKEHWAGVPVAEYLVSYGSGATETIPVRYSMEVRDPEPGWCDAPIVYNSLGVTPATCETEGLHLYAMQWRNPRPEDQIASVTLRQIEPLARVVLAGMAAE